ncbi:FAD-dependent oxidoreductase [Microvirga massiliensis]|uniref:FAD-dependent oxidoreductase n=1 Tax=Microvirga massiliensis TaxID=1033741 RepID=UPI00062BA3CC|nr:GMC family oxidoreductase [Microvirga massiliensis]
MIIDARTVPQNTVLDSDICIIGGGAAGITLTRELAGTSLQVCLLESGGLEFAPATQNLYAGESTNPHFFPLDVTRLRYFGGSTNHWSGWTRPFQLIEFEKRAHIPYSGWPFGLAELEPYYRRAQVLCEVGPFAYEAKDWTINDQEPLKLNPSRFFTSIFQFSPPTRFGQRYREELAKAQNVRVYLRANVTTLETPPVPNAVSQVRVATLGGPAFQVRSRRYVLAAGGIENVRLLLSSDQVETAGLGNQNDLVGRFFMDHPIFEQSGQILFKQRYPELDYYRLTAVQPNVIVRGILEPATELTKREGLPNFYIGIRPATATDVSEGAASIKALWWRLRKGSFPEDLGKHLGNIISDLDGLASAAYGRIAGSSPTHYATFSSLEPPPNPDSRITLTNERDALGLRRVKLDWRLGPDFEHFFMRAHELLGQELGRVGLGRLRIRPRGSALDPMENYENGHHHMGATRMHPDPKQGVVDSDGRVHGIANLYVAGSSVFPTYGCGTPTLTIVALATRLADHLKAT